MHWTVTVLILFAVGEALWSLPGIIWVIRCPADSPHFKMPPRARLFITWRR